MEKKLAGKLYHFYFAYIGYPYCTDNFSYSFHDRKLFLQIICTYIRSVLIFRILISNNLWQKWQLFINSGLTNTLRKPSLLSRWHFFSCIAGNFYRIFKKNYRTFEIFTSFVDEAVRLKKTTLLLLFKINENWQDKTAIQ